jgi:hypothetical protein
MEGENGPRSAVSLTCLGGQRLGNSLRNEGGVNSTACMARSRGAAAVFNKPPTNTPDDQVLLILQAELPMSVPTKYTRNPQKISRSLLLCDKNNEAQRLLRLSPCSSQNIRLSQPFCLRSSSGSPAISPEPKSLASGRRLWSSSIASSYQHLETAVECRGEQTARSIGCPLSSASRSSVF